MIGCLNLADVTKERGIHMTYYGTGCIFHYDDNFPQGSGKGFKESDTPNFTGSYYSYTKVRHTRMALAKRQAGVQLVTAMVWLSWPGSAVASS